MQQQLLEFQELLSSWYLLVLDNKLFVGALVLAVWIFVALIYATKGFFLKKKQRVIELQNSSLQEQLVVAEKNAKQLESNLSAAAEQMEEEQQVSSELLEKIAERNQTVVEKIRELAESHDLNEQLVGSSDAIKMEVIWQQQDNIIMQLAERLAIEKKSVSEVEAKYKQEIATMAASESSAVLLKEGLEALTEQVAELGKRSTVEQENKTEGYDKLELVLDKNQSEMVALVKDLTLKTDKLEQQVATKPIEAPLNTPEILVAPKKVEPAPIIEEVVVAEIEAVVEPVKQEPPVVIAEPIVQPPVAAAVEEKTAIPEKVAPAAPVVSAIVDEAPKKSAPAMLEPKPVAEPKKVVKAAEKKVAKKTPNKSEAGRFGKVMGLSKTIFSKKKASAAVETTVAETKQEESAPLVAPSVNSSAPEVDIEVKKEAPKKENYQLKKSDYDGLQIDIKGKFKGLFSKKK